MYCEMFELKIYNGYSKQLYEKLVNDIKSNKQNVIFAVNPNKVVLANDDPSFKKVLQDDTLLIADGIGLIYGAKLLHQELKERICGVDVMKGLCQVAADNNFSVFIYGTNEENLRLASLKIKEMYPNINICGYLNGFEYTDEQIVDNINYCQPDIVFVALGSPKQELFIDKYKKKINAKVIMGVGGSVDVFSGHLKRAPEWVCNIHLEWLFRMLQQPKRFITNKFLLKYIYLVFSLKLKKER
ncbi:MAG: WecB/TagA/CpsF family glycosyltransferase [Erysipelotrichaceae bacterium]